MFFAVVYLSGLLIPAVLAKGQKDCSPFPHVSLNHGRIHHIGHQKYSFSCNKGYFLASPQKVRCYRGNWTSLREPLCLRIQGTCDDPPAIANGIVLGEDRNEGDKVMYKCKEGFLLMGRPERSCSRSGYWSGRTPACMDEKEPLQNVAERLKDSFVTELGKTTIGAPEGRLLDRASLRHGLELALLVDRSSSLDPVHLENAKEFIKYLLHRFGIKNGDANEGGTRAAVLAFGTNVQLVFNVDDEDIDGPMAASEAIDAIQPNGGGTNMEGALKDVLMQVSPLLREKAKRALFLMTDGEPNIANPEITPQDMANLLKREQDFEIFTVGIGRGINRHLLAELASEPPLSHVFVLEQYPDLKEMMKVIEDTKPPAPPISKDQCGHSAPGEDRPWLVVLYVGGKSLKMCSGVLICSQWVLTSASCVEDGQQPIHKQEVFATLGERDLLKDERDQTNFYVVEMKIHPQYDRKDVLRNNLALLKLNFPAAKYRPACLPSTDRAIPLHQDLLINASIAGWGITSGIGPTPANGGNVQFSMASTPVSLATEDECPGNVKGMSMFCAGQGKHSCMGLMGSPLIAVDPTTRFNHVLGILSGRSYCRKGHNQYVELTKYIKWINQESQDCQRKHWGLEK